MQQHPPKIAAWRFVDPRNHADEWCLNLAFLSSRAAPVVQWLREAKAGDRVDYALRAVPTTVREVVDWELRALGQVLRYYRLSLSVTEPISPLLSVEERYGGAVDLSVPDCLREMLASMIEYPDKTDVWEDDNTTPALLALEGSGLVKGEVMVWPWPSREEGLIR